MKRIIQVVIILMLSSSVFSQDNRALRAARMSFSSAEDHLNKGNYQQAATDFEIVINTIPAQIDSRRNLNMRLESLIHLIDIYFYRHINIQNACKHIDTYLSDINVIRHQGTLRASELLHYQQKEKEYLSEKRTKCAKYESIESDMERFQRRFEEEFE